MEHKCKKRKHPILYLDKADCRVREEKLAQVFISWDEELEAWLMDDGIHGDALCPFIRFCPFCGEEL